MQILITIISVIIFSSPNHINIQCNAIPSATGVIFQSLDNGQSWQDFTNGLPVNINAFNLHTDQKNIYLASGNGLYQSTLTPKGQNWKRQDLLPKDINGMCSGGSGAYVNSYEQGWFQPSNNFGLWIPVYPSLKHKFVYSIYESPENGVFAGNEKGIIKSADGGNTWREVYKKGAMWNITELDGVIIAGGSEGLIRSIDYGESWQNVYYEQGSIRKISNLNGYIVAITNPVGNPDHVSQDPENRNSKLIISNDKGLTWKRIDENLHLNSYIFAAKENTSSFRSIKDLEIMGDCIYCSLETGIYRSADMGKSWELLLPTDDEKFYNISVSGNMIFALKIMDGC